jgi:hypothetical protein
MIHLVFADEIRILLVHKLNFAYDDYGRRPLGTPISGHESMTGFYFNCQEEAKGLPSGSGVALPFNMRCEELHLQTQASL